jgi:hypothetical protein
MLELHTTPVTAALQRQTRTIPIVFVFVGDPVGEGIVAGLPRPGGNITGFIPQEAGMAGKWLELLTEIAPGVKRAAAMFNPDTEPFVRRYFLPSFEAAAHSLKVAPITAPVRSDAEIEQVMTSLGREPRGGLVLMPDAFVQVHRAPIILLAARYNVPAVYAVSNFVREGGLLSYGSDGADLFRRRRTSLSRGSGIGRAAIGTLGTMAKRSKIVSNKDGTVEVSLIRTRTIIRHGKQMAKGHDPRRANGRPPGSLNKITRTMKDALIAAAVELGQLHTSKWEAEAAKPDVDGMKHFFKVAAVRAAPAKSCNRATAWPDHGC